MGCQYGYIINEHYKTDGSKRRQPNKNQPPKNQKELIVFLGANQHSLKQLENLSSKTDNMRNLLGKEIKKRDCNENKQSDLDEL